MKALLSPFENKVKFPDDLNVWNMEDEIQYESMQGRKNPPYKHTIWTNSPGSSYSEKEMGVIVSHNLEMSQQCPGMWKSKNDPGMCEKQHAAYRRCEAADLAVDID